ncbi:diacylglycerol kinase [Ferrimonas sp.]|uniref:diacylglycerol kinase n=1 Tax=Ferrimonas sp. TaxID=2080861 RepID=UPI003A8E278E
MKSNQTGFLRLIYATRYSWLGLKAAWKNEAAFRQELVGFLVLAPLANALWGSLAYYEGLYPGVEKQSGVAREEFGVNLAQGVSAP